MTGRELRIVTTAAQLLVEKLADVTDNQSRAPMFSAKMESRKPHGGFVQAMDGVVGSLRAAVASRQRQESAKKGKVLEIRRRWLARKRREGEVRRLRSGVLPGSGFWKEAPIPPMKERSIPDSLSAARFDLREALKGQALDTAKDALTAQTKVTERGLGPSGTGFRGTGALPRPKLFGFL